MKKTITDLGELQGKRVFLRLDFNVPLDENGNITLVAAGTTTIKATFTETNTHAGSTASYTLTVNPSNCRWVEVTDNTTLEDGDEVVEPNNPSDGGNNTGGNNPSDGGFEG